MTKPRAAVLLVIASLAGCDYAAPTEGPSVVTQGTEPNYQISEDGSIKAASCQRSTATGDVPSACAVDSVFAQQVRYPHDLVRPHTPGPGHTYPIARAAYEYIYGEMPDDGRGSQPAPGVLIPVQPGSGNAAEAVPEEG